MSDEEQKIDYDLDNIKERLGRISDNLTSQHGNKVADDFTVMEIQSHAHELMANDSVLKDWTLNGVEIIHGAEFGEGFAVSVSISPPTTKMKDHTWFKHHGELE